MTLRYPSRAVLGLAGACALLWPSAIRADDPVVSSSALAPAVTPSAASVALDELEAQAPKDHKDPAAITANHARVAALVESNILQSGQDFSRAATLLGFHFGEFRVVRMQYELQLAAAAKGDESAGKALATFWDQLMRQVGRPDRFDFSGWAQKTPEFAEFEPAPACIQAVWRDPAAARAAVTGVADNPEIKAIVDADQADRRGNWATRTPEEHEATTARDKARNARMREIIAGGEVRTAHDFARAGLVMQHSARFPGYRLAHELAVSAMLLGDRSSGRWLAAASYDRMLRSIGLDQRFGTQYGPAGLAPVDEAGICDNQRTALGCPTLAQARNRTPPTGGTGRIGSRDIVKPGNVIEDGRLGVKAAYPTGWVVRGVAPGDSQGSVMFSLPDRPLVEAVFYFRVLDQPQPESSADSEALLRKQVADKEADRQKELPGYANRPGSLVFRPFNGRPGAAWIADYPKEGAAWSEYLVRILGGKSVGLLFLKAPADQIEALKPALDAMAGTVQLP